MEKVIRALKLAKECTYADEMTEGAKEYLRKEIDGALKIVLLQADISRHICPKCRVVMKGATYQGYKMCHICREWQGIA